MKFCPNCGTQCEDQAVNCPSCNAALPAAGQPQPQQQAQYQQPPFQQQPTVIVNNVVNPDAGISPKSRLAACLLCLFLGGLGIHRFYAGKVGTGILWLITAGCCGIGWLVDLIMILCGSFRDIQGRLIQNW